MLAGSWNVAKFFGRVAVAAVTGNKEQLQKELHPVPVPPQKNVEFDPVQFDREVNSVLNKKN